MGSKAIFTIKMPQGEEKWNFFEKVKYFMLKCKIKRLSKKGKHILVINTRYDRVMAKLEKEGIKLHYSVKDKKVVSWISW